MGYTNVPVTWVTLLGRTDFKHPSFQVEVSQIIIHKTDQPNVVVNLLDADGLSIERVQTSETAKRRSYFSTVSFVTLQFPDLESKELGKDQVAPC